MKLPLLLLLASVAGAAGLDDIKTVYLLPMTNGFDQYLAIRLTTGVVLQVVTDPEKADAILTDRIGTPQFATSSTKATVWVCNYTNSFGTRQ